MREYKQGYLHTGVFGTFFAKRWDTGELSWEVSASMIKNLSWCTMHKYVSQDKMRRKIDSNITDKTSYPLLLTYNL